MSQTKEGAVKDAIKRVFKTYGVFFWMPGANLYGRTGQPDFIAVIKGRMLAVEAKATPKEQPTANQASFLRGVKAAGGVSCVVHNENVRSLHYVVEKMMEGVDVVQI